MPSMSGGAGSGGGPRPPPHPPPAVLAHRSAGGEPVRAVHAPRGTRTGGGTSDCFADVTPKRPGAPAGASNPIRKSVFSPTRENGAGNNPPLIRDDVVPAVTELKQK